MGVLQQVIALLLLHVLVLGTFLIDAREIEVALSADSSILVGKGPLEASIHDPQRGNVIIADKPDAGNPSETQIISNFQEDDTVKTVMTTLQRELAAVDQMVKLQEKKLQVLQDMRNVWLQEQQEKKPEEEVGDMTRRRRVDIGDAIDRKLDATIVDTVAAETGREFATYFVESATIKLKGVVADMKMTKMRPTSPMELIAVAYKDGVIEFYTSTTELLLSVDTEKNGIKDISLELQDNQPCLVVTYDTPSIALYELLLVIKSSDETESGVDGKAEPQFTISTGPEYQLSVSLHRQVELSSKASAVTIARASRQLVVAVAKDDGIIDFLAFNGTSLRQMQTQASISVMETRRNMLAFSNGRSVLVSSMTRAQGSVFHSCPGSSADVSSIAFDAIHPDIMYTGTQRGEVFVYSVNAGLPAEAQACKLLSRSMVSKHYRVSLVSLATTKTYIVAAGERGVAVFNVSRTQRNGISLSRMCLCNTQSVVAMAECQQLGGISAMAFSEGAMESHMTFISTNISGQSKLTLFHSLLPDKGEVSAFQWTVFVYVGVAVATVIGSQFFIKWQRRTNVNPWDSIKRRDSPYGKYVDSKGNEDTSEFEGEDFGRYNSLSDELRRKIVQQKRGSTRRSMDDDTDF
ncbi:hypothetical protein P3T76_007110 [Phytophthora citrophthora]|uniref:Uncharacterized protein n=1 Tax=Phytophthora citrophthora TaxID=4793 RepID=A0AAD9LNJ7_9STRA|nr:hypothetical protein P3T76_007110 [Phytophthora citrophthora]